MSTAPESNTPKKPAKKARGLRVALQLLLGLVLGLVLVEVGFSMRDEGAFPHLNLYVEDAELGARLRPSASQRFKFQDNAVSDITIGADGYRVPTPSTREHAVLVVGDSQVFGLGVNDDETMPAQLAALSGRPVINGGVPTYGPLEFNAVVREQLAEGGIETIVCVVNFANDVFETDRPNRERHRIWDGWAVRSETAPTETPMNFPGRFWLYNQSHAFYAARRLWHETTAQQSDDRGFASEGTWRDLANAGEVATEAHALESEAHVQALGSIATRIEATGREVDESEDAMFDALMEETTDDLYDLTVDDGIDLLARTPHLSAGDIVDLGSEEESRSVRVTTAVLRRGARLRSTLLGRYGSRPNIAERARAMDDTLQARLEALASVPREDFVPSVLSERLEELAALAAEHHAQLVVVALPLDVMVSESEWAKYGVSDPPDLSETAILLRDLVETAHRMGIRAIDVTEALRHAESPTFQRGDFHLTRQGHAAFAAAVLEAMQSPAPLRLPSLALAPGRTPIPEFAEFDGLPEATVAGSSTAGCGTYFVREYLRVSCYPPNTHPERHYPLGARVLAGNEGETLITAHRDGVSLLVPRPTSGEMRIEIQWTDRNQILVLPSGELPAHFEAATPHELLPVPGREEENPVAAALCDCHRLIEHEALPCASVDVYDYPECELSCVTSFGVPEASCLALAPTDLELPYAEVAPACERLFACARGRIDAIGTCPEGQAHAFATRRCFPLCSDEVPCAEGVCAPVGGSSVCVAMSAP